MIVESLAVVGSIETIHFYRSVFFFINDNRCIHARLELADALPRSICLASKKQIESFILPTWQEGDFEFTDSFGDWMNDNFVVANVAGQANNVGYRLLAGIQNDEVVRSR